MSKFYIVDTDVLNSLWKQDFDVNVSPYRHDIMPDIGFRNLHGIPIVVHPRMRPDIDAAFEKGYWGYAWYELKRQLRALGNPFKWNRYIEVTFDLGLVADRPTLNMRIYSAKLLRKLAYKLDHCD